MPLILMQEFNRFKPLQGYCVVCKEFHNPLNSFLFKYEDTSYYVHMCASCSSSQLYNKTRNDLEPFIPLLKMKGRKCGIERIEQDGHKIYTMRYLP